MVARTTRLAGANDTAGDTFNASRSPAPSGAARTISAAPSHAAIFIIFPSTILVARRLPTETADGILCKSWTIAARSTGVEASSGTLTEGGGRVGVLYTG